VARTIIQRLHIVRGQIDALANLISGEEDCKKVTQQFYAINSALKKAMEIYFKENINSCLKAVDKKEKQTIEFLLGEIVKNK